MAKVTLNEVVKNEKVQAYLEGANRQLEAIGYTEHGHRHAGGGRSWSDLRAHVGRVGPFPGVGHGL